MKARGAGYEVALMQLVSAGQLPPAGALRWIRVLHHPTCPYLRGGDCRCEPDITVEAQPVPGDAA